MKLLKKILNITLVLSCIFFVKKVIFEPNHIYVSTEEKINLNTNNYTTSNDKLNIGDKQEIGINTVDYKDLNILKSVQTTDSCKQYCLSCGPGREAGYSSSYVTKGCRNWEGYAYGNYGSTNIPYWINMNTMNSISNETHRNTLINDIRYQAWLWNQAVMHDGTGQIVNLYEVGTNESSLPGKINNKKVVEIRYESIDSDTAGEFYSSELLIKINYLSSGYGDRPGRNVDTPMHEMGHLLGLNDLDTDTPSGTHKALMGYNRATTNSSIDNAITYHDIQGIAVLNGKHTTHRFNRYFVRDGKYLHVCFYCDTIDSMSSIKSGSLQLELVNNCTHDYKQLVSLGNKHWVKCTKCYKVITHSHQFTSYSWIDLRQHEATCNCGASTLQGHAVSSKTYASGNKYATCLLCGGRAEIGFIQINSFNRNKHVALKNNYVLPNGLIVLFESDLEKYFCETLEFV